MKICHFTSTHNATDVRIFHKECVSLAKAGYDVYVVARGDSYEKCGIHISGIGKIPNNRLKRMTVGAKRVYQKALELDCDIYHFHEPELLRFGLKLKKKGKKVIFDSHECHAYQLRIKPYLPKWMAALVSKIYRIYENSVIKKFDAVVFPCTMNGKNPFEGLCKRTPIISNAAILNEFFCNRGSDEAREARRVIYIGSLTEERGITMDVIASAKAGATLVLAGEFSPPEYKVELESMPEFSCVDYRGSLDRDQVAELLSSSRIGLCTLLDRGQYFKIDTFGIKVFEYMSIGLPVILSNSSYNCYMVEKYQFGLCVDPENIDEIAGAIRYLLDNPEEARRMGENGRKAMEKEFNWSVEEKKLLALYEDIQNDDAH